MSFNKIIKEELEVLNLLRQFNSIISEGFGDSDFGANAKISSTSVSIPKENSNIKSASSGVIENHNTNLWCKNQTSVKFTLNNNIFYLEYCGITNLKVSKGNTVSKGTILGTTTEDVKVNLYDSRGRSYYFKELNKIPSKTTTDNTTTTTDNTGVVKYDDRYKKFQYKSQTAKDAISGVNQDNRYKKFDW
jgi:hypothetical protein